jgi:hypothetical protein
MSASQFGLSPATTVSPQLLAAHNAGVSMARAAYEEQKAEAEKPGCVYCERTFDRTKGWRRFRVEVGDLDAYFVCGPCRRHMAKAALQKRPGNHRTPASCGTPSGYQYHYRHGQPQCDPCRAAMRAENRRRYLIRRIARAS